MNQQEQATKHAAIFQDTINGTNDPTPWPVTMWASSGDTIWTAGTARTAGEDSVGMIYDPGDTIVHRNTTPRRDPRHRILRHQTGGRAEPDGRDARGHRTMEPPPSPTGGTPWPRRASTA